MLTCMQNSGKHRRFLLSYLLQPAGNPRRLHRIRSYRAANVFEWNWMIKKVVESNVVTRDPPLLCYVCGIRAGLRPNGHTFMYLLKALVAGGRRIEEGEEVHASLVRTGFVSSEYVSGALVGFYVECGFIGRGRQVFDEMSQPGLVLWTVMIRAYACASLPETALEMFGMMRRVGVSPDMVVVATVVSACGLLGELAFVKAIHCFVEKSWVEVDGFVISALVSTYGEFGSLDQAYKIFKDSAVKNAVVWNTMIHQCVQHGHLELGKQLFETMPERDVVSWNSIIGGFARTGRYREALALFHDMPFSGLSPNILTLSSTLSACAGLGALETGVWIHNYIEQNDMNSDGSLVSSLIDMYSKCGNIEKAVQIFDESPREDLFTWTSIICGMAMHGDGEQALHYFSKMTEAGIEPDGVTLTGVLSGCAHAGLLDKGWWHFRSMEKVYSLVPKVEHYGCIVDLLGRMGYLQEAYDLIMKMPIEANEIIWRALLSGCSVHNNIELGEVAARKLLEMDPYEPWSQVMLSKIYAEEARWEQSMRSRKEIKEMGLKKSPGYSSIEVNGNVHGFLVGDTSHPRYVEIKSMLEKIARLMKL